MTHDRGKGGHNLRHGTAADGNDQQNRHRRLGNVKESGDPGPTKANRSGDICAAGPAAADGAWIGSADQPRNENSKGNAADEVAGQQGEGDPGEVKVLHRPEV